MSMKRGSDRDPSPVSKKSRSSLGRYDSSDDERPVRKPTRGRSPSPRSRYGPPPDPPSSSRDEYGRSRGPPGYKVLCVSSIHPKASDEVVKDSLYREFKKYGEVTIKLMSGAEPEDRLAYVYYRNPEDAREARHSKQRIILYDKAVIVEPVYENPARNRPRSRSYSPVPDRYDDRYRPRSPYDRVYDDRYDYPPRGYLPPGPYREYRPPPYDYNPRGPPYHGGHHRGPYYGHPPMHGSYGGRGYDRFENKKDRFPNYLHHISPEDDPLATRTLFAGNLEINITEEELRRIFNRYGVVEDIDIKRPPPGTGNAYAFVRFENLDQANRCKVELSGQYIGKFQVKIGYGKATPSTRIWVGGLGSWTSLAQLEREFDRFGAIKKIEYSKGDNWAYILYETIEAAQAAVQDMRGFPLGGADRRLRTDFADPNPPPSGFAPKSSKPGASYSEGGPSSKEDYPAGFPAGYGEEYYGRGRERGRGYEKRGGASRNSADFDDWNRRPPPPDDYDGDRRSRSPASPEDEARDSAGAVASARTLTELARKSSSSWNGALILKNSLFPTKLHLTAGESSVIDLLLKDEVGKPQLRITQRLRLDPPKLEDVSKRVSASASHAIFVGMPSSTTTSSDESVVQTRPMRNLVTYLKQKEAAGVISLSNKEADITGVLYAFPPCAFATEMLRKTATSLTEEAFKEDYLVVVVVKGGSA